MHHEVLFTMESSLSKGSVIDVYLMISVLCLSWSSSRLEHALFFLSRVSFGNIPLPKSNHFIFPVNPIILSAFPCLFQVFNLDNRVIMLKCLRLEEMLMT